MWVIGLATSSYGSCWHPRISCFWPLFVWKFEELHFPNNYSSLNLPSQVLVHFLRKRTNFPFLFWLHGITKISCHLYKVIRQPRQTGLTPKFAGIPATQTGYKYLSNAIHTVFRQVQKKAILKTFTAISQILTNLTGDEARLCLPRADDSLVTANALCCLVFCVARLAVDLVKKI